MMDTKNTPDELQELKAQMEVLKAHYSQMELISKETLRASIVRIASELRPPLWFIAIPAFAFLANTYTFFSDLHDMTTHQIIVTFIVSLGILWVLGDICRVRRLLNRIIYQDNDLASMERDMRRVEKMKDSVILPTNFFLIPLYTSCFILVLTDEFTDNAVIKYIVLALLAVLLVPLILYTSRQMTSWQRKLGQLKADLSELQHKQWTETSPD